MKQKLLMGAIWAFGSAAIWGAFTGCAPPVKKENVTIGGVLPETGATSAPSWVSSAQLALKDANAGLLKAGTTVSNGSLLQFVYAPGDSVSTPLPSAQAAIKLVQAGAKAIITDLSSDDTAINSLNYVTTATISKTAVTVPALLGVPVVCVQCTSHSIGNPAATSGDPPTQDAFVDSEGWNFRTVQDGNNENAILMRIIATKYPPAAGQPFKFTFIAQTNSSGIGAPASFAAALSALKLANGFEISTVFTPIDIYDSPTSGFLGGAGWAQIEQTATSTSINTYSNAGAWSSQDCFDGCPGFAVVPPVPPATTATSTCSDVCGAPTVLNDYIPTADTTPNPAILAASKYPGIAYSPDIVPNAVGENSLTTSQVALVNEWVKSGTTVPFVHLHGFRNPALVVALQQAINGQEGVSSLLVTSDASGTAFTNEVKATGAVPQYTDSMTYDAAMTLALATALATVKLEHPNTVTGAQIRDAMKLINDPKGTPIGVGPDQFEAAVKVFQKGGTINYNGASGPVDYDAHGNINQLIAHYVGKDGAFVDEDKYDCITDPVGCPVIAQ